MANFSRWKCVLESQHSCGQMKIGGLFEPRWRVYNRAIDEIISKHLKVNYSPWWDVLNKCTPSAHASPPRAYARPRNLIHNDSLVDINMNPVVPCMPYIAVSYTWAQNPTFVSWRGRRVTTQALAIATRLARHTSLALWIDAICIEQDDDDVKQEELPKMADIYRGAVVVLCLVDDVGPHTCAVVRRGVQLLDHAASDALRTADDIYGLYMFATAAENDAARTMFGHRWWERAWTFQEAVVNRQTYLVGENDDSVPIEDVLSIALTVRRRAATMSGTHTATLHRPSAFWDSVAAMAVASQRPLSLGESIACVWRRNAGVRHDMIYAIVGVCGLAHTVRSSYKTPFESVLRELLNAAASLGDYSWLTWCSTIDHSRCEDGLGLVPIPERVGTTPFTSNTPWRSAAVRPNPSEQPPSVGIQAGIILPLRSAGVVRSQQATSPAPLSQEDTVGRLRELGHADDEVWDMLFGLSVGLMTDIETSVGAPRIASAALRCTLLMIRGEQAMDGAASDVAGALPHTQGIAFTNYALMAAQEWLRGNGGGEHAGLVVISCQAGDAVIPFNLSFAEATAAEASADKPRVYLFPVEHRNVGRSVVAVAAGAPAVHVYAVTLFVRKVHSGSGEWQTRIVR